MNFIRRAKMSTRGTNNDRPALSPAVLKRGTVFLRNQEGFSSIECTHFSTEILLKIIKHGKVHA